MTEIVKTSGIVATTTAVPDMSFQWDTQWEPSKDNFVLIKVSCGTGGNHDDIYQLSIKIFDQNALPFSIDFGQIIVSGTIRVHTNANGYILTFDGSMLRPGVNNVTSREQSIIVAAVLY